MNAPVKPLIAEATSDEPEALVIDFDQCPEPLDANGRAGWPQIIALQAHVQLSQTQFYCDTCGSIPCRNPSFCAGCREVDAKQKPVSPHTALCRKLLADHVPIETAWRALNNDRQRVRR